MKQYLNKCKVKPAKKVCDVIINIDLESAHGLIVEVAREKLQKIQI